MKTTRILFLLFLSILTLNACKKDSPVDSKLNKKAQWIENAFKNLTSGQFSKIKAIAWWNEDFDQSYLRIDSSPESIVAYKKGVKSDTFITTPCFMNQKLISPSSGIYHAAYPDFGGTEDLVTSQRILDFEQLVNKKIVWAYFSNNWYQDIKFPTENVKTIQQEGKIPFIRMMPRSNFDEGGPDPIYTMQKIIDGVFDNSITQWAIEAAKINTPLLVEFGTEVNGDWFPWNGQFNGGAQTTDYGDPTLPDGPERFRDAYRHIIDIFEENNVDNITWFFHIDAYSSPETNWNSFENYYPGDDYIDWLGVSLYGPQESTGTYQEFSEILNDIYPSLSTLSNKPIAILEFAITELD